MTCHCGIEISSLYDQVKIKFEAQLRFIHKVHHYYSITYYKYMQFPDLCYVFGNKLHLLYFLICLYGVMRLIVLPIVLLEGYLLTAGHFNRHNIHVGKTITSLGGM